MRIEEELKLDYSDVLFRPKRSTLKSRKDVNLLRTYRFKYSKNEWSGIPIIAANMDGVGELGVAEKLNEHGMITSLTKQHDVKKIKQNKNIKKIYPNIALSVGIKKEDFQNLDKVLKEFSFFKFICIDVANGYTERFTNFIKSVRDKYPTKTIIAGNVVTADMTQELVLSGADIVKVGIGPGSICTTRMVAGIGVPQITAIMEVYRSLKGKKVKIISDGGIKFSGDIAKAIAAGADAIMMGSIFAGTDESPGKKFKIKKKFYKQYRGMGSIGAMSAGSSNRYFQKNYKDKSKFVPEGVDGRVEYKGKVSKIIYQLKGGLRSSMGYIGAKKLSDIKKNAKFIKITKAGFYESMVHSVETIEPVLNYKL